MAQTAFATLVDNALEHGDPGSPPRVTIHLREQFLAIRARDGGRRVAESKDAKEELRQRIQFPAEEANARPGDPIGVAWLTHLLAERNCGSELTFTAGDGCLSWREGIWTCESVKPVSGFLAVARIAI